MELISYKIIKIRLDINIQNLRTPVIYLKIYVNCIKEYEVI